MRWTPQRIITLLVAVGLIALGMWLIFQGTDGAAVAANAPAVVNAPEQQTANPAALGFAMLAGGVLVAFMSFRKV